MLIALEEHERRRILHTLQYALETFQGACQCGKCDPCTHGVKDLQQAINTLKGQATHIDSYIKKGKVTKCN